LIPVSISQAIAVAVIGIAFLDENALRDRLPLRPIARIRRFSVVTGQLGRGLPNPVDMDMHIERCWILAGKLSRPPMQRFDLAKQRDGLVPAGTIRELPRQFSGAQLQTPYDAHDFGARRLLSSDCGSALEVHPKSLDGLDEILSQRSDTLLIPLRFRRARQ